MEKMEHLSMLRETVREIDGILGEYSRLREPPVRRLRTTVPAAWSQVSVAESH